MFVYLKRRVIVAVPFLVSMQVQFVFSLVFVPPGGFSLRIGGLRRKDALRDCIHCGSRRKKRDTNVLKPSVTLLIRS